MAGGKETPRQKMIGLMYLVLTAFLAISVDSAILDKFKFLDEVLYRQYQTNVKKNADIVQNITAEVEKKGNRPDDVKVKEQAELVRQKTAELIKYTEDTREKIVQMSGGRDPETQDLTGAKNTDEIADLMIRQKKGTEWQNKINEYCDFLTQETGITFPRLALDGKEDPYYKNDPKQRAKNFSQIQFESTPTIAGMASISQMENQLINYETQALEALADKVGAKDVAFDKIVPMVLPESNVVAAGAKYKAKMFISASASGITPTMTYNGSSINVGADGMGEFEFVAKGGKYDKEGQLRKTFMAEITFNDSTYKEQIEYIVAKPVVQIQSASVQALYRNCGNNLVVNVPALGQSYNPSFKVKGGSSIKGRDRGVVTIVPTKPKVTLSVYSDNTFIDDVKFNVRAIPKPDIVLKDKGGKALDEKRGVDKAKMPTTIRLDAEPDADFQSFLPNDALYRVTQWEVTLARGPRAVKTKPVKTSSVNIRELKDLAKPGDRLVIEVKQVQRRNFKKETEVVNIPTSSRIKQVPIN